MIDKKAITTSLGSLGILGEKIVVHSSYKSIGTVAGGPQTVVAALIDSFATVMVPTTSYRSVAKHPEGDMPKRNGCEYGFYHNWTREVFPFDPARNPLDDKMGIIPKLISGLPSTHRSATPWHSWAASGEGAEDLCRNFDWQDTDRPLKRLIEQDGLCLMLGVDLSSCSVIHIAEEMAGRKHFIRWCTDSDRTVRRVEAQGCGRGFNLLEPYCRPIIRKEKLGNADILVFSLKEMVATAAKLIKENPTITMCSKDCIRCIDSAAGGPILMEGDARE